MEQVVPFGVMDPKEMQRLLRATVQDTFPGEALAATERLKHALDERQRTLVSTLRAAGVSWEDIARSLGISRQGLQGRVATWEKTHGVMETQAPSHPLPVE